MENKNKNNTPQAADDKKTAAFKKLVEKGKSVGHLTAQEIDNLIVDLDLDVDELEKLNDMIDSANINIIDDFSSEALDGIPLEVDLPKETDAAETVATNDNAAMDDPVKVYLKEIGRVPLLPLKRRLNTPCGSRIMIRLQKSALQRQTCALLLALQKGMSAAECSFWI